MHLCRFRIDEGLGWFGRVADTVRLNPFAFNLGDRERDLREPERLLGIARAATGGGGVIALVPVAAVDDPLVWSRTLLAMAQGGGAVHYREGVAGAIASVVEPLRRLQATLPLWTAAESIGRVPLADESAEAWLTQLGPRRLAVVVIDRASALAPRELVIDLQLPRGLRAQRMLDLAGEEVVSLPHLPNQMKLTLPEFHDATILYLELDQPQDPAHAQP